MAKEKKSFEKSLNELEEIVEKLERGEMSLDDSIEIFQKGVKLSKD
jgi:exodeoxyribonuclease VII small subunit